MSMLIFPTLIGVSWPVSRKKEFSTIVQVSQSGKEIRLANYGQAIYNFKMSFDYLPNDAAIGTDYQTLAGFFELNNGALNAFLFDDPYDDSTTLSNFGTGDGVTVAFQLARTQGGASHLIYAPKSVPTPQIFINGVLQSGGYTIATNGLVTFGSAPSSGLALTWSGDFYYVVRFKEDDLDFDQTTAPFSELKDLELKEVVYGL
jgi:uncharacterized protein (TIGR02217 family)